MKKSIFKILSVSLTLCIIVSMITCLCGVSVVAASSYTVADSYAGGTGTADDPFQITNASELAKMVNSYGRVGGTTSGDPAYYILMNDIDLNPTNDWSPDSSNTAGYVDWQTVDQKYSSSNKQPFVGHLDGNGKTISHLYVNYGVNYNKFGALIQNFDNDASVKNLTLENFYCRSTQVGGIAGIGRDLISGTPAEVNFENVTVRNGILDNVNPYGGSAGGILGSSDGISMVIKNCSAYDLYITRAKTSCKAGAILGNKGSALVSDCSASGCIGVTELIGGASGNGTNGTFTDYEAAESYASGTGTAADPYHIKTSAQLYKMVRSGGVGADGVSKGYFVLDNDIMLNDTTNWAPDRDNTNAYKNWGAGITDESTYFIGDFDGQYHTITGLYSNNSYHNGFIHMTNADVSIKRITFEHAFVAGARFAGIVIGYAYGGYNTTLSQVMAKDVVADSTSYGTGAGALIGEATRADGKRTRFSDCAVIDATAYGILIDGKNASPYVELYGCWAAGCVNRSGEATELVRKAYSMSTTDSYLIADSETVKGETALTTLPNIDWEFAWAVGAEGEYPSIKVTDWQGKTFSSKKLYQSTTVFKEIPSTFEATVKLPADIDTTKSAGVIIGNYSYVADSVNLEIAANGNPRLYIIGDRTVYDIVFDDVSVTAGEWTHLAVTLDTANGVVSCYINGELKQQKDTTVPADIRIDNILVLGGDRTEGNNAYFRGTVKNLAIYSDVRTAEEIATDSTAAAYDTSDLLGGYDFSNFSSYIIEDQSVNNCNFIIEDYKKTWFTEKEPVTDYSYTFAFVGDTQMVSRYAPDKLSYIYDWLVDISDEKNLQFVFGLGDITDRSIASEWEPAIENIRKLDGVVPYSLIRGNHDSREGFTEYVTYDTYTSQLEGMYEDSVLNTYQTITVGGIQYLIMCLDYGAKDDVLAWADEIIAAHPEHTVIITTHAYLNEDATLLDGEDWYSPSNLNDSEMNDGDDMWDKLIRKHANISMVVSGHISYDGPLVTTAVGDNGNTVTQILIDQQGLDYYEGSTGLVALFHFSADGKVVDVEWYSPLMEMYYGDEYQFEMTVNAVYKKGDLNGDGERNILDLIAMKKILASLKEYVPEADIDGADKCTSQDMILFRKYLLGIYEL